MVNSNPYPDVIVVFYTFPFPNHHSSISRSPARLKILSDRHATTIHTICRLSAILNKNDLWLLN